MLFDLNFFGPKLFETYLFFTKFFFGSNTFLDMNCFWIKNCSDLILYDKNNNNNNNKHNHNFNQFLAKFWPIKKRCFSSSKIGKVRAFQRKSPNFFEENLSNTTINLWIVYGATMMILSIILNNLRFIWLWNDLFGSKCHMPMFQSPVCV